MTLMLVLSRLHLRHLSLSDNPSCTRHEALT